MGFLDKLPFGKKKEEFSMPAQDPFAQSYGSPQDPLLVQPSQSYGSAPNYPPSFQQPSYPQQQSPMYPQQGMDQFSSSNQNRDIELLRAKLDAVQATLDSLSQRFANIERYINESARKRW